MKTESLSTAREVSALRIWPDVGVDERQARRECVHVTNLRGRVLVYGWMDTLRHAAMSNPLRRVPMLLLRPCHHFLAPVLLQTRQGAGKAVKVRPRSANSMSN